MDLERLLVPLILTYKVAFLRKAVEMVASCEKIENCGSCDGGEFFFWCVCVWCDCFCSNPIHDLIMARIELQAIKRRLTVCLEDVVWSSLGYILINAFQESVATIAFDLCLAAAIVSP